MARLRRMLAPITSIKHYVHHPQSGVASGAVLTFSVATSVVAPASANAFNVVQGSVIKAVFIEFWVFSIGADVETSFTVSVEKIPSGLLPMTFAESINLGAYENKKNILYVTQGLVGSRGSGSPVPIIRQYFKIPRGKQRMGLGDRIVVNLSSVGQTMQICGITTYKEYT